MPVAAESIADTLYDRGCRTVFAYPGTSELALCEAIDHHPGLDLVNARGDKEAVFLAGGANQLAADRAVAIVHGARGLTNALGAVSDLRRSEIATLVIVGLPSTTSAPYSPPHGEIGLIASAGEFARAAFEVTDPDLTGTRGVPAMMRAAAAALSTPPFGPVLLGVPQDILETPAPAPHVQTAPPEPVAARETTGWPAGELRRCLSLLRGVSRPVIMVDDFALRDERGEGQIAALAAALDSRVLQVDYRRGPMLFQRLTPDRVPGFAGMYDPLAPAHRRLLDEADMLITVEDRNMYPRVVGPLPACPKVAITSNPDATVKNGYLAADDVLAVGLIHELLPPLYAALGSMADVGTPPRPSAEPERAADGSAEGAYLVATLGRALQPLRHRIIVDDSQMFGGLLALHYRDLAPHRVFGSHGGFVGSGLAKAAGAATAAGGEPVICSLGDQGFLNGIQALATIGEQDLPVIIVLCNNGASVSLRKQSRANGLTRMWDDSAFLRNSPGVDYVRIAAGYGVAGVRVDWLDPAGEQDQQRALLDAAIETALRRRGPFLIEVRTPGSGPFWDGVWSTSGADQARPSAAGGDRTRSLAAAHSDDRQMTGLNPRTVVLWDVDGTLVRSAGLSRRSWTVAFERVAGCPLPSLPEQPGATARRLIGAYLRLAGLPADTGIQESFFAELARTYAELQDDHPDDPVPVAGAVSVLSALADAPLAQSVVTGNSRAVAEAKLTTAGLTSWLALGVGAYGDEADSRAALVTLAADRTGRWLNRRVPPSSVVVIGDSAEDVAAASAVGAASVGVVTERYSAQALRSAGATHVVHGVESVPGLLLGSHPEQRPAE